MKHVALVNALIFLFALTVNAQENGMRTPAEIKAEEEVLKVDTERAEAYMHGDTAALSRILADDCVYVHPTGKVETKEEIIAGFKAGDRKYISIDRDDVVARVYGNRDQLRRNGQLNRAADRTAGCGDSNCPARLGRQQPACSDLRDVVTRGTPSYGSG